MRQRRKSYIVAVSGIMTALVFLATTFITFPLPAINGYFNAGECFIYLTAALFGGWPAAIAGGLGAALADIATGFAFWAPYTFVIKFFEGLICGVLCHAAAKKLRKKENSVMLAFVPSVFVAAAFMCAGYFVSTRIVVGSWAASYAAIIPNVLQCLLSAIAAFFILSKSKVVQK